MAQSKKKEVSNEMLMEVLVSMDRRIGGVEERMSDFATKDHVEEVVERIVEKKVGDAKEEILSELRPIARAVDKDAVTVVDHGRRIIRVEKHLNLA